MSIKRASSSRVFQLVLFAIVLGASFLIGYGATAKAWPGVPDRDRWYGYFLNQKDDNGSHVIENGYPGSVNTANEFINFLENQLKNGSSRDKIGAAFTIQTMLGSPYSRSKPPTAAQLQRWEANVRYAESRGWITWVANFTFTGNSYYQGTDGGGSDPHDDAFYYENGTRVSMIFRNSTGIAYVIKRDCGNPLTNGAMPGLDDAPWTSSGRTTVSTALAVPGQTVTFHHYVKNNGPAEADGIRWTTFNSPSGATITTGGPNNYNPGQEINVNNENFTIPSNAAANTKYCRQVGWDPTNNSGGRNGRGAATCVTVYIPAKIKATMTVNPQNAIAGDTITFTPGISVTSSGNPLTVNCTITRTSTPPSGAPTSLGNQPCTDTSGNSNINVSGGGVTLKTNSYTIPDTLPVGTKVCDTMTITNPVLPIYFANNADRTASACVTVAKTPFVRFMGNDVFAGGDFAAVNAACNTQAKITTNGRILSDGSGAGSVGEYGVFATNKISGFGSASKVLVGSGALGDAARSMTFANSEPTPALLGYFGVPQHCITDYVTQFGGSAAIGAGSYNVAARGSGAWHVTGALTLSGTMPSGGQQVYYADGDVTIGANLVYPATYAGYNAIPSLLVITKGNIYVPAGVTQMDGVFVARGNGTTSGVFYTCWPHTDPASTSNPCNNAPLTVNGSVSASRIDLFRSYGATGATPAARKDPGEVFNFNTEAYLRSVISTNGSGQTTVQTTNTLELPPRF